MTQPVGRLEILATPSRCFIDPTRPCGCCSAPSQQECPYRYLLADSRPRFCCRGRLTGVGCLTEPPASSEESAAG